MAKELPNYITCKRHVEHLTSAKVPEANVHSQHHRPNGPGGRRGGGGSDSANTSASKTTFPQIPDTDHVSLLPKKDRIDLTTLGRGRGGREGGGEERRTRGRGGRGSIKPERTENKNTNNNKRKRKNHSPNLSPRAALPGRVPTPALVSFIAFLLVHLFHFHPSVLKPDFDLSLGEI